MDNQTHITKQQLILGIIAVVVIAGALAMFYRKPPSQPVAQPAAMGSGARIVGVVMAHGIDSNGNPIGVTSTFSAKTDRIVYAVIKLQNATKKTKVSLLRKAVNIKGRD